MEKAERKEGRREGKKRRRGGMEIREKRNQKERMNYNENFNRLSIKYIL